MNRKWWLAMALLLCLFTATAATPSTLAYIADSAATVRNTFRVQYLSPQDITVPVNVHKTVLTSGINTIGPKDFSFCLENLDTGHIAVLTTGDDGCAAAGLSFSADDVGKAYRYRLYEINSGRENVIYDESIHYITITLYTNEQHELSALLTMDEIVVSELAAEFVNFYEEMNIPDTGDHEHPMLWLALLLWGGVGLILCRRESIFRRH